MAHFYDPVSVRSRVRALVAAAHALARAAPRPVDLPFRVALFTDKARTPDVRMLIAALPRAQDSAAIAVILRPHMAPDDATEAAAMVRALGHYVFISAAHVTSAAGPIAHGVHNGTGNLGLWRSCSVHTLAQGRAGAGADLAFVSPVLPTDSHPDAPALGPARAAALAARLRMPCLALGGMNPRTAQRLHGSVFQGLGVIGALAGSLAGQAPATIRT